MDYNAESLKMHREKRGKLVVNSVAPLNTRDDLSIAYTPGVAEPCREIARDPSLAYDLTIKSHTVAVISDGSAVLGLGDIGAIAGLPVMEGKCALFKEFAGVDAFPLVIDVHDVEGIIAFVKAVAPTFGGINLEDIAAPKCFEIERRLVEELDIPVMHDDQHGTAIVTLAGLINALKIVGKKKEDIRLVISGFGAAGTAIMKLLKLYGVGSIIACDRKGIVSHARTDLNAEKLSALEYTDAKDELGTLQEALVGADVFVGVSAPNLLVADDIRKMAKDPIIFALSNPTPEIMPDEARVGGAAIVATGRSDFPNQLNNVLAFPGIFKGALKYRLRKITNEMKLRAAEAIAAHVENPTADMIIPLALDRSVADIVAEAMKG